MLENTLDESSKLWDGLGLLTKGWDGCLTKSLLSQNFSGQWPYENCCFATCTTNNKSIILVVFEIIAGMLSNKKSQPTVTKLLIRSRKVNTYFVFITQSYFLVLKTIKLNSTHYFIIKIPKQMRASKNCNQASVWNKLSNYFDEQEYKM